MKKLMLLAAMLAMTLVGAAPAMAQVSEEFEQEIDETGGVEGNFSAESTGDSANQCAGGAIQFGQSGNTQNTQGGLQYTSTSDDIEAEGSSFGMTPSVSSECKQQIQQAAAAGKAARRRLLLHRLLLLRLRLLLRRLLLLLRLRLKLPKRRPRLAPRPRRSCRRPVVVALLRSSGWAPAPCWSAAGCWSAG